MKGTVNWSRVRFVTYVQSMEGSSISKSVKWKGRCQKHVMHYQDGSISHPLLSWRPCANLLLNLFSEYCSNFKAFDLLSFCVTGRQRWHGDFPSSSLTILTMKPSRAFFIESLQIRQRGRKFFETVIEINRLSPEDIPVTLTSKLTDQTSLHRNIPERKLQFSTFCSPFY
jgi:hypothetical protein